MTSAFQEELGQVLTGPMNTSIGFVRSSLEAVVPDPLDSALIGYLPPTDQVDSVLEELEAGITSSLVRRLLFPDSEPRWLELLTTDLGRTGLVCIPWFADELTETNVSSYVEDVCRAAQLATDLDARCISLAGMLPAKTGYGYGVLRSLEESDQETRVAPLTTGHSTTVVAVVKSALAALEAVGRRMDTATVAFVGVGSIGGAAVSLLLSVVDPPERIILCDLPRSKKRLKRLADYLHDQLGYGGPVEIAESDHQLPESVYRADLIVGATSAPNVLDVERLVSGAIVVDDSFPHCFDTEQALARMQDKGDVLLVGAGLLDCGSMDRTLSLPQGAPPIVEQIQHLFPSRGIASCQLEGLLWARWPNLPLTLGMVTLPTAKHYWQAVEEAGLRSAPLHLGSFAPGKKLLTKIRCILNDRQTVAQVMR
jgi:predicted amino acid dehydrogenase